MYILKAYHAFLVKSNKFHIGNHLKYIRNYLYIICFFDKKSLKVKYFVRYSLNILLSVKLCMRQIIRFMPEEIGGVYQKNWGQII